MLSKAGGTTVRIVQVPVMDSFIISEQGYFSFREDGPMNELERSLKYVPEYERAVREEAINRESWKRLGERNKAREMARVMKSKGYMIEEIRQLTGLSKAAVQRLKA